MFEKIKQVFMEQYLKNQSLRESAIQQEDTFTVIAASGLQVQLLDLFGGILGISRELAEWILKDNEESAECNKEKSRAD